MAVLSPCFVPRCPRCFKPIAIRAKTEAYSVGGQRRWAHVGCKAGIEEPSQPPAEKITFEDVARQELVPSGTPDLSIKTEAPPQAITDVIEALRNSITNEVKNRWVDGECELRNRIVSELNHDIGTFINTSRQTLEQTLARIDATVAAKAAEVQQIVHVFQTGDRKVELPKGTIIHEAFDEVKKLLEAGFNVFIPGPTGAGKTHMGEQLGRAMGCAYTCLSGSGGTTEVDFVGTSTPNLQTGENVYHETPFVRRFEFGGLVLLDEGDAFDENVLLKMNSAIGNGILSLPKRTKLPPGVTMEDFEANPGKYPGYGPVAYRHKDFMLLMAANTWGHGATRHYCGRNKLDGAFMNRFQASTVPIDYDPKVEKALCPDKELYKQLNAWRKKMREACVERHLSTRFFEHAYKLLQIGYKIEAGEGDDPKLTIAAKLAGGWTRKEQMDVFGREVASAVV